MSRIVQAAVNIFKVAFIALVLFLLINVIGSSISKGGNEAFLVVLFTAPLSIFALLFGGLFTSIAKRKNSTGFAVTSFFFNVPIILLNGIYVLLGLFWVGDSIL
jgi:uncharacterized protein with PQ loop repeat